MQIQRYGIFLAAWASALAALAAGAHSVWDGVYTKDQAKRGQQVYSEECARCHGQDLAGGEGAPPLMGADFLSHWNGKTAGALYELTSKSMPTDDAGNLSTREYADVLTYIFSANDFPAGDRELAPDAAALNDIKIEPER
jgi:quinoprotein glucose dehydrogenase